ncbi:MFS transporter [Neobacillus sp. Marseille-QA0830]
MNYYLNVNRIFFIAFFHNLIPAYVIERLFWEQRGMSVISVVLCEMIYAVTVMVCEIPSGILADRFGRKVLLVLGAVLSMLEFVILLLAYHFWTFALVVFLAGISSACSSGALNALLYDSLLVEKKEKDFEKIIGRINSVELIGAIVAALSGSVLANFFGFGMNYVLSVGSMLLALVLTFVLNEPPRKKEKTENESESDNLKVIFIQTIRFFNTNTRLVWVITNALAISACITYLDEFWQLYLEEKGFQVLFFGVFSTIIFLARIPGNLMAANFLTHFKAETIIITVLGLTAAGFFLSAIFSGISGILMIILIFLASGVIEPVVSGFLHHRAGSEIRATMESFQSLIERGITFLIGIGFGLISTSTSVNSGFIFLGTVLFFVFCFFYKYLRALR